MNNSSNNATVILISFVTALVTAVLTVLLMVRFGLPSGQSETVDVPNLVGLSQNDARTNLEGLGVALMIGGREETKAALPGAVISQSPLPGTRIPKGTSVSVVLAKESSSVPDLKGRTIAEATLLAEQSGYKIQLGESIPDDSIPKDRIASQVPVAGTFFETGRTITLLTSSGPDQIPVPKLTFLPLHKAKQAIQDAGFKVGEIKWLYSGDWDAYTVLGQDPKEGDKAKLGSNVDLTVNPE